MCVSSHDLYLDLVFTFFKAANEEVPYNDLRTFLQKQALLQSNYHHVLKKRDRRNYNYLVFVY